MSSRMRVAQRSIVAIAVGGSLLLSGAAAPAVASAEPAPTSSSRADVGVSIDPVSVIDAISAAVNDQSDRGGAVRAGLDVALTQTQGKSVDGKGPITAVAIANKNQDINSEGQIWAQSIDIKNGNYVLYFYAGSGSITNNGDGGWINWGAQGQIRRDGNTIHFD